MKETLEKLKLIQYVSFELPLAQPIFVQLLQQQVDYSDLGLFSNLFEAFSSSPNHYLGLVEAGSFRIRRRRRLFDRAMLPVVVTGTATSAGPRTLITAQ